MNRVIDYVIEGALTDGNRIDFGKEKLAVHAFVKDQELAHASVDASGHYRLAFKYDDIPPTTQLRVVPAEFSSNAARALALSDTFNPTRYVVKGNSATAHKDLRIPSQYIDLMGTLKKKYRFHGEVFAATYEYGELQYIEPMAAVKVDFYLHLPTLLPVRPFPGARPYHLGYAYSGPDGSYDFQFKLDALKPKPLKPFPAIGGKPVVEAKISQYVSGVWQQIYTDKVDWELETDLHKDFFVPVENIIPVVDPGIAPAEGFRFSSLGLFPIDATRIVKGYGTSQLHDPISLSHQPFCQTLRVFGLFAQTPPVVAYKVQIAVADEDHAVGTWEDLTDPLYNLEWDDVARHWDVRYMGPDPSDLPGISAFPAHVYRNIDTAPEPNWNEHALKFVWNSTVKPDGFYALRMVGYDVAGVELGTFEMPVLCIANTLPEASIEAIKPKPTDCGALQLTDQTVTFRLTAFDPDGHVLWYDLNGTRGKDATSAGSGIYVERSHPDTTWTGIAAQEQVFNVDPLPAALSTCPAVAYAFELRVQGAATNGYDTSLISQRVWKDTNLVVMKPTP